ncbi:N-acetyltransferase GCN5 [Knoellia subterranea KCTC 19937]|uniref:N-acetyltransferase GCN5 n=1 Tax=Knoellia subterranea KCTC 19937 TaxID=1385521 RepID=A0A0A0JPL5_9MICO|nr:N-acetyltransferase GCN5 [Knoellia subterranea KCTC 19937]
MGSLRTPTLETSRLRLRPVVDSDGDAVFDLMSNAHVLRYWDSSPWTDRSLSRRFVERSAEAARSGFGVRVVVERMEDGEFLGWVSLTDWNPDFRSASLGFVYTEASWGHGYATEAAGALLDWAFGSWDLNRVQAEADTRNIACGRVLEKLGFVREGTLREDCIVDGVVSDSWVFGLLRRDVAASGIIANY